MKLFCDGQLVGEESHCNVEAVKRPCMLVGSVTNGHPFKGSITDMRIWDCVVSWEESKSSVMVALHADVATEGVLSITGSDLSGATIVKVEVPADSTVSSFKAALHEKMPSHSQLQLVLPDGRTLRAADDSSLVTDLFNAACEKSS